MASPIRSFRPLLLASVAASAAVTTFSVPKEAAAQQHTFHLDRLEVPGAPEDGAVLFRPVTQPKPIFFGQLGFGYSLNPLHTNSITADGRTLRQSHKAVINDQVATYATLGVQFLNRFTVAATLPVTIYQDGQNPNYAANPLGGGAATTNAVSPDGQAVGDLRIDARAVLLRTANEKGALGLQGSLFAPTGNGSSTNFGGDGQTSAMAMISGDYDFGPIILTLNTGVHFRPHNRINNPLDRHNGLGIGNEWRYALGAFVPFKEGKYRLGVTVFGQTGIESDSKTIGDTFFARHNSSLEWHLEGRVKFGPKDHWWVGLGAGTLIANGYGAPDLRVVGLLGAYVPFLDSKTRYQERREEQHDEWRNERANDADRDGIADDIDACPMEAEDHFGPNPDDGCPLPADRDHDGIPDNADKCPDAAEDKDGIDDGDGCPEDDADSDGVLDAKDACPKVPGSPSADPAKNGCPQFIKLEGSQVRILQQVHFPNGSSTILPDSFPMLQEIANLLKANPQIKLMTIEGYTDDRGAAAANLRLSQGRAGSVLTWLAMHGVEDERLDARGYGKEKPIESNATVKGRAANRRVEFKITEQSDANPTHGGSK